MKKKLICIFTLYSIGLIATSCSNDENIISKEFINVIKLDESNVNLAREGNIGIIFNYSREKEVEEFAQGGLAEHFIGLNLLMRNYPTAVSYRSTYKFSNGIVVLENYGFINYNNDIIEDFIFNEPLNQYETFSGAPVPPGCPGGGWSDLGTCNDLTNLQACIGAKGAMFAMQNMSYALSGIGHGVEITYLSTSNGIKVCGRAY